MPSALYLIGSEVKTLTTFEHIEPYLNLRGIQVPDKAIVPVIGYNFFKSSILAALVGERIEDALIRDAILKAYENVKLIQCSHMPWMFNNEGILDEVCDESTDYQLKILPPRIQSLASYSRDQAASEVFTSKCICFNTAYFDPIIEHLQETLDNVEQLAGTLEKRVKTLANTKLSELRQ